MRRNKANKLCSLTPGEGRRCECRWQGASLLLTRRETQISQLTVQLKKGKQLVAKHDHWENCSYFNQELFTQSIKPEWKNWHKGNMPWITASEKRGLPRNIATDKWLMVGSNAFSVPECMEWCWAKGVLSCVCLLVVSPIWKIRGRWKIMSVDCDVQRKVPAQKLPAYWSDSFQAVVFCVPKDLDLLHLAITRDKMSFLISSSIYWVYCIKEVVSLCHSLDSIFQRSSKRKAITSRNLNSKVIWHASKTKWHYICLDWHFSIPENVP